MRDVNAHIVHIFDHTVPPSFDTWSQVVAWVQGRRLTVGNTDNIIPRDDLTYVNLDAVGPSARFTLPALAARIVDVMDPAASGELPKWGGG